MFNTLVHSVRLVRDLLSYNLSYYSLSYSLIGSIMAYTTSTNSLSSALSSYDTYLVRSITLIFFSSSSSLKTFIISKLLIKGVVPFSLSTFIYIR